MSTYGAKRRAIRHASDSAHAWARNLRLGDVHSKLLLSMLTLYVDGEGKAFVGLDQLAEDCEFSPDTVRRRLRWLEEIGAIARTAQWIDANGRRGAWGRGKRTSDEIRLLLDADADEIEARAAGIEQKIGGVSTPISPSQQQGLTTSADSVGPAPALGQPSHCGEGLDSSEPEPEPESPQPLRGEGEPGRDLEEPDDFAPAWSSWPGHEVMRRDLALAEFRLLSREKQRLCRAAIPQFVRMQERLGRTRPPNFHLWIRNAGFEEFPNATLETAAAPAASSFDVNSAEGKAIKALYAFARTSLFEHRGCVIYPLPVNAQGRGPGSPGGPPAGSPLPSVAPPAAP